MAKRSKEEAGLLPHLDGLLDVLYKNVPAALKDFDADAIHDARVSTRRLKAALDLLCFVLSEEHRRPFGKVLRKIRRRMGPLRDLDVMIEHMKGLSAHATYGSAAKWLHERLLEKRKEEREKSIKKATSADLLSRLGSWWAVREEIVDAEDSIDMLLAESLHLQLDAFTERANRIGQAQEPSAAADQRQDPHQLRIAGKLLRYTLELAEAQGHGLPAGVLRNFKKMQEQLGNWHDYVVLVETAMQTCVDQSLAYHDLQMQEAMLDLTDMLLGRAQRELNSFAKYWKTRGTQVAGGIREKFPLTRSISEAQTGPGPSGSDGTPAPVALPPDVASTA